MNAARTDRELRNAYSHLRQYALNYRNIELVEFDDAAAARATLLRKSRIRVGTMDLRIAAIALVNDALLLSRNLRDFQKVPNLRVEDWTRA